MTKKLHRVIKRRIARSMRNAGNGRVQGGVCVERLLEAKSDGLTKIRVALLHFEHAGCQLRAFNPRKIAHR